MESSHSNVQRQLKLRVRFEGSSLGMKVTITAIEESEPVVVRGTSAFGKKGKFGCALVAGDVVFIAARGHEDNLKVGNTISVEPAYESLSDFHHGEPRQVESMEALDKDGDYLVKGTVTFEAPEGVIVVTVRGCKFRLEREHLNGQHPQVGDPVEFVLHGLAFWDEVGRFTL